VTGRKVAIAGYGIVSSAGWQREDIRHALEQGSCQNEKENDVPFARVFDFLEMPAEDQIPKRGDRRSMGPTMLAGCCAAGLALETANLKDDLSKKRDADLLIACRITDRDEDTDNLILSEAHKCANNASHIARYLRSSLRPTFFLTQIPNLLAANISIVHGVLGSSRTFLGNEPAGAVAIETAIRRVVAGNCDVCLTGGAFRGSFDLVSIGLSASELFDGPVHGKGRRGIAVGSSAAFLVLESEESLRLRRQRPVAYLTAIGQRHSPNSKGALCDQENMWWLPTDDKTEGQQLIVVAATPEPGMAESILFPNGTREVPVFDVSERIGLLFEAALPTAIVCALTLLEMQPPGRHPPRALVYCRGVFGGESLVLLDSARHG
jgi:3-oxoacyl-[acyl-carrier-protein] synthase II